MTAKGQETFRGDEVLYLNCGVDFTDRYTCRDSLHRTLVYCMEIPQRSVCFLKKEEVDEFRARTKTAF